MKRFNHYCSYDGGGPADEVEEPDGMFVRYEDAQAELDALRAELAREKQEVLRLRGALRLIGDFLASSKVNPNSISSAKDCIKIALCAAPDDSTGG